MCKEWGLLYSRATAIKFHHLMVGALIIYATHLAHKWVDQEDGQIVANDLLLHTIVYSNVFKSYIKSLSATYPSVLSLPTTSHIQDYQEALLPTKTRSNARSPVATTSCLRRKCCHLVREMGSWG